MDCSLSTTDCSKTATANVSVLLLCVIGACVGFWPYNKHPAKIFMGDSGALFAGFMLSTLSITGIMSLGTPLMYLPLLILAIPILDVAYSSLRRISKGKSPFVADAEHIHHKLLHHGLSQDQAVLVLSSISMVCATLSVVMTGAINKYAIIIVAMVLALPLINLVSKSFKKNG